jgi:hypothetical protein
MWVGPISQGRNTFSCSHQESSAPEFESSGLAKTLEWQQKAPGRRNSGLLRASGRALSPDLGQLEEQEEVLRVETRGHVHRVAASMAPSIEVARLTA